MEKIGSTRRFFTKLLQRKWLVSGIMELTVARPANFKFLPGQSMRFYHNDCQRDYTLVSHPDADTLDFCIAIVEGGIFSNEMAMADVGSLFQLSGPHGRFIYHRSGKPSVFVATGTGVAPFVSFCHAGGTENSLLLHGVSSPEQLIYAEEIENSVNRYIPCFKNPTGKGCQGQGLYSGRVTDYLKQVLANGSYDFYLCGRREMIRDATRIIDDRFDDSRLYIETYS